MKDLQKITADLSQIPCPFGTRDNAGRVETGALEINDDWPGIFIRGDNALYYSFMLSRALEILEKTPDKDYDVIMIHTLRELTDLMACCRA